MVLGIIKLLGATIFLYLVWRNLSEDYRDDLLISYGWSSVIVLLLGGRLVSGVWHWEEFSDGLVEWWSASGFSLGGGLLCVLLWTWWFSGRNGWKLWPFLEDVTPIYYLWVTFILGDNFLNSGLDWQLFWQMMVALLGYVLASVIRGKYRSLTWYRSGKKGFVFFFTNTITGLLLFLGALWFKDGWINYVFYLSLSLIFGLGLVMLGESYGTKS